MLTPRAGACGYEETVLGDPGVRDPRVHVPVAVTHCSFARGSHWGNRVNGMRLRSENKSLRDSAFADRRAHKAVGKPAQCQALQRKCA